MRISYDQHEKIIENVKDNCSNDVDEEIKKKVSDRYEAMIFSDESGQIQIRKSLGRFKDKHVTRG